MDEPHSRDPQGSCRRALRCYRILLRRCAMRRGDSAIQSLRTLLLGYAGRRFAPGRCGCVMQALDFSRYKARQPFPRRYDRTPLAGSRHDESYRPDTNMVRRPKYFLFMQVLSMCFSLKARAVYEPKG